jgi:AcrR family transcriptional regulator
MPEVKSTRKYDSTSRRVHARRNRNKILNAAGRLFLSDGYAPTTVAAIARAAGVSVETIYKTFGGKPGLVREIYERGLKGSGPVSAYARSDEMREKESNPKTIMRNWGLLTTEVAGLVTPIRLLMRSAALTDQDIKSLLEQIDHERLERMQQHANFLAGRGYLAEGVSVAEATDVLWTCSSVEIYELLVLKRGWSPARFADFIAQFMISTLLGDPAA